MGIAAKKYYNSFRTPQHMAKGLEDAINFVLNETSMTKKNAKGDENNLV